MKPNLYEPAGSIREVPGVRRRVIDTERDSFVGSAAGLVATGILTADMLPGQPGRPMSSATYRPHGARWRDPGVLHISIVGVDRYRAVLGVPLEERERRAQADKAALAEAEERQKGAATEERRQPIAAPQKNPAMLDDDEIAAIAEFLTHRRRAQALSAMGMLHRRKLPDGWRVIDGQRPA